MPPIRPHVIRASSALAPRLLLFPLLFLLGLITAGCAGRLASPDGPNSSLIVGRVVIDNRFHGPGGASGTLKIGRIEELIELDIASVDGTKSIEVTTGERGYFFLPNLPQNEYYLRKITIEGSADLLRERVSIQLPRKAFFEPVPGKIVQVGLYHLTLSEKFTSAIKLERLDPDTVRSYLRFKYPTSPWLSKNFDRGKQGSPFIHHQDDFFFQFPGKIIQHMPQPKWKEARERTSAR